MFSHSGTSSKAYLDPVVVTFEILFLASIKSQDLSVSLSVGGNHYDTDSRIPECTDN